MKAIAIERYGDTDVLGLHDLPVPEIKPGEVLVKVEASGVNYIDTYQRTGLYKVPHFPFVLGMECAGTIESLGAGVDGFAVGDRVAAAMISGAYAEYAAIPASRLVKIPDGVSTRDAAAVMLQGLTAHYLINSTFVLERGHIALVHAGAGGVGMAAIQLARHLGAEVFATASPAKQHVLRDLGVADDRLLLTQLAKARGATVITTVSTPEKAALSKAAGADHTIAYTDVDFADEVRRITDGAGVHVAYDSVGKTTWEKSLACLRPRGYFVLFGASSGPVPPFDLQLLAQNGSLFATRPSLGNYIADPAELASRAADLFGAVRDGSLKLRVEHTYPLADAARAQADLQGRATTGKLLLLP